MLSESVFQGILEIRKLLKEKIPNPYIRFLIILGVSFIALAPLVLFDYWVGTFIGLGIVIIIFLYLIFRKSPNS